MTTSLAEPFPRFTDLSGDPLTGGYVYVGAANTDPTILANRISIFFDAACTVAAAQPLRTSGGFIIDGSGAPKNIYVQGTTDFSVTVADRFNVPRYSIASYPVRMLASGITFDLALVTVGVRDVGVGVAFCGTVANPWASTISRTIKARTVSVFDQTQPVTSTDFATFNQLMMPILAVNQTSIVPAPTWFNAKNTDTAASTRTALGAYTVVPKVALPSTDLIVKICSLDDAGLGFRSTMARIVAANSIAVRVFVPNTGVAVDGRFSLSIEGNPAIVDPIL